MTNPRPASPIPRALVLSIPFAIFVALRVAEAFRDSMSRGNESLGAVLVTIAACSLVLPIGSLIPELAPRLRARALRRMFAGATVYCGRWTESFADVIGSGAYGPGFSQFFSTYGVVVGTDGLSFWAGWSRPRQRAAFTWGQIESIESGKEPVRNRPLSVVELKISQRPRLVGLALYRRAAAVGVASEEEIEQIVAELRAAQHDRGSVPAP